MAEYHVGAGIFGIYAGTVNPVKKDGSQTWKNKTECTNEAINAVRDFMVSELLGGLGCPKSKNGAYQWKLKDGRIVELRISVKDGDT